METIIKTNNLNFLNIIQYPDIEIKSKQATFITGESGCGKSTLLKLINGVVSGYFGEVTYNGRNIENYIPIQLRKEILLCCQSIYLFDKTIKGNFDEYYKYLDLPYLSNQKVYDYLQTCCLDFSIDVDCASLSGGERHRVFIAICLSLMPKVLMLDEPTSALDDQNANNLMANIKIFCKEKDITLIIVCHSKSITDKYADCIINLEMRSKT